MIDEKEFLKELKNDLNNITDEYSDEGNYNYFLDDFKSGRVLPRSVFNNAWLYGRYRGWNYEEYSRNSLNNLTSDNFVIAFAKNGEEEILVRFDVDRGCWNDAAYLSIDSASIIEVKEVTKFNAVPKY